MADDLDRLRALAGLPVKLTEAELPREFRETKNPSRANLLSLLAKTRGDQSEGLRGLIATTGDIFVWDGYYANHDEVERAIGLEHSIAIHLYAARPELDADMVDEDDLPALCQKVINNPYLKRLYGEHFDFEVEQGYDTVWASSILAPGTENR